MAKPQRFPIIIFMVISYLLVYTFFLSLSSLAMEEPPNIILLGWDGVQRNNLYELLNRNELPNLKTLINEGTIANITITDHSTDTKGGWSQVLTGLRWWNTGVYSNEYWFNSIPAGYTILERVEDNFGKDNIDTAFITSFRWEMEIQDWTYSAEFGKYTHEAVYSHIPSAVDVVSVAFRNASVTGPLALQFIENYSNSHFFAFIHFGDPDYAGHVPEGGENSELYEESIKTCDFWLGQIINKLRESNILQKTLIYLTSDHGFDENGRSHLYAPNIVLATNDKNVKRNGDQVDVAPTIYYRMGMWGALEPSLDGVPLQIDLPYDEEQRRQNVLMDKTPPLTPAIMYPAEGTNIDGNVVISFAVFDEHLSAVLLLIDNKLETGASLTWNSSNGRDASGTYEWNTRDVDDGYHLLRILAFDEHGAFNAPSSKSTIVKVTQNGKPENIGNSVILVTAIVIALIVITVFAHRKRRLSHKQVERPEKEHVHLVK
jgi:hypothetical protein